MQIDIKWHPPLLLAKNKTIVITEDNIECLGDVPSLYFFSRKFGKRITPFYIGETSKIRTRLKQHLATAKIYCILRGIPDADLQEIAQGPRYFHFGYLCGKATKAKQCLEITQKFMIEEALAQGCVLINKSLTKIPTHNITFSGSRAGKAIFPSSASVAA